MAWDQCRCICGLPAQNISVPPCEKDAESASTPFAFCFLFQQAKLEGVGKVNETNETEINTVRIMIRVFVHLIWHQPLERTKFVNTRCSCLKNCFFGQRWIIFEASCRPCPGREMTKTNQLRRPHFKFDCKYL